MRLREAAVGVFSFKLLVVAGNSRSCATEGSHKTLPFERQKTCSDAAPFLRIPAAIRDGCCCQANSVSHAGEPQCIEVQARKLRECNALKSDLRSKNC